MTVEEEIFNKNVAKWHIFYPKQATLLGLPHNNILDFYQNSDGSLNLKFKNRDTYFHAITNPQEEAKNWFETFNLKGKNTLIIFGVGLGYLYDAAKKWLRSNSAHQLIFLEPTLEVIQYLLKTERGTAILDDRQVWLTPMDVNEVVEISQPLLSTNAYLFVSLPIYQQNMAPLIQNFKSNLAFALKIKTDNLLEFVDRGYNFCSNYYRNLLLIPKAYFGGSLVGKFKGIPAIICGAGPSLAKSLPLLKELKDRALIFGGGTAMNGLNTLGFLPHFGVGIDPNPAQFTRLVMNQGFETPYFYRNRMSTKAVDFISGPRLFFPGTIGYDIGAFFEKKLNLQATPLSEGYNVVNFSLSIALELGCNPIIFVGVDLAYTEGLSYCPGILNHPLHERKDYFGTKTIRDELVQKTDIYGQPVLTLWKWIAESLWFSLVAQEHSNVQFYNGSSGGIGFDGILNLPLQIVSKSVLKKSYDLSGLLHATLMEAFLPEQATSASILEALKELLESLKKSQMWLESLYQSLSEILYRNSLESEVMPIQESEHEKVTKESLQKEIGYTYLLKTFGEQYQNIYQHEYRRLQIDESILPQKEYIIKKLNLEKGKLIFQIETAKTHINLIETVLDENASKEITLRIKENRVEPPQLQWDVSNETYSYENGNLNLSDPLLNLNHQEQFNPNPEKEIINILYENGNIKHTEYLKEGKFHGPSSYYNPDGQLLSRHWFLKGVLEGKGECYYPNGNLFSINRYKNGNFEGRQVYFYPSGLIKSILHYSAGWLHGDIQLYASNGQMIRSLSFIEGKRNGYDKIWNELGNLMIEAEFEKDLPIGVAKQWHPSGTLAKSVKFTPDSPLYEILHWDEQGAPIAPPTKRVDFFDEITKQTQVITQTLQAAANSMETVIPVMKKEEKLPEGMHHLSNEMDQLQENLKHLNAITGHLVFKSGLDPTNPEEAIWKTPEIHQEMEEQVNIMNVKMGDEINLLTDSLHKLLNSIKSQNKEEDTHGKS